MKKVDRPLDELRAEYRRADLGTLLRGKYAARYARLSNVVVIDESLTKAFPNSAAVNEALRVLLSAATSAATPASTRQPIPRKRAPA